MIICRGGGEGNNKVECYAERYKECDSQTFKTVSIALENLVFPSIEHSLLPQLL